MLNENQTKNITTGGLLVIFAGVIASLMFGMFVGSKLVEPTEVVKYTHGVTMVPQDTTQQDDFMIVKELETLSRSLRVGADYFNARRDDAVKQVTAKWKLKEGAMYDFDPETKAFVEVTEGGKDKADDQKEEDGGRDSLPRNGTPNSGVPTGEHTKVPNK